MKEAMTKIPLLKKSMTLKNSLNNLSTLSSTVLQSGTQFKISITNRNNLKHWRSIWREIVIYQIRRQRMKTRKKMSCSKNQIFSKGQSQRKQRVIMRILTLFVNMMLYHLFQLLLRGLQNLIRISNYNSKKTDHFLADILTKQKSYLI